MHGTCHVSERRSNTHSSRCSDRTDPADAGLTARALRLLILAAPAGCRPLPVRSSLPAEVRDGAIALPAAVSVAQMPPTPQSACASRLYARGGNRRSGLRPCRPRRPSRPGPTVPQLTRRSPRRDALARNGFVRKPPAPPKLLDAPDQQARGDRGLPISLRASTRPDRLRSTKIPVLLVGCLGLASIVVHSGEGA